jgi:hypothetical protein
MSISKIFAICTGVIVLLGALFPVNITRVQNTPKEDAKYVRRIFNGHSVGQLFNHDYYSIHALEIVARADTPHTAILIANENNTEIGRATISLTQDDQWFKIPLTHDLNNGTDTVTFTTEKNTSKEHAILMRIQVDSDFYTNGNMFVDGEASYGDIAFRTIQRAPAWQTLLIWGQVNSTSTYQMIVYFFEGLVVTAIILLVTTWVPNQIRNHKFNAMTLIPLIAIFILSIIVRAPYSHLLQGVYGGDAFNYLSKTYAFLHGHDPFAADPRKGPFYPLLLLPAFLFHDPLLWSRWIGIISAAATAVLVPLIGRKLGIAWPFAVLTGLLVAINRDFIFESPSGLAMTLFTCMITLSVYCYLKISDSKKYITLLSVSSALAMLTRFEGALVGAILLPFAWIKYRLQLKQVVKASVLWIAIMAIPFISIFWSGVSGIRTPQDIQNDDGLYLVHSLQDKQLQLNIQLGYEFFTNTFIWKGDHISVAQWLAIGLLAGLVIIMARRFIPKIANPTLPTLGFALLPCMLFIIAMNNETNCFIIVALFYTLIGIGIVLLVKKNPLTGIPILLVALSQIAVITWILPKGRYFLPALPFLYLFLVYTLNELLPRTKKYAKAGIVSAMIALCTFGIYSYTSNASVMEKQVEEYNNKSNTTDALFKALLYVRDSKLSMGTRETNDLYALIYIPEHLLFTLKATENQDTAEQELAWIQKNHIQTILVRDTDKQFAIITTHPELFSTPQIFTSKNGDAKISVYTLK